MLAVNVNIWNILPRKSTLAYISGCIPMIPSVVSNRGSAMPKSRSRSKVPARQEWASAISDLRHRSNLSQTAFGRKFHSSAMAVSRWERGTQEPTARSYIELGLLAGDPNCWYFWGRAGLRHEDLMRILPQLRRRLSQTKIPDFQLVRAGSGSKKTIADKQ